MIPKSKSDRSLTSIAPRRRPRSGNIRSDCVHKSPRKSRVSHFLWKNLTVSKAEDFDLRGETNAKDYSVLVVRYASRGGSKVLLFHFQGLQDPHDDSLPGRKPRAGRRR